jgi:hypothetical protein
VKYINRNGDGYADMRDSGEEGVVGDLIDGGAGAPGGKFVLSSTKWGWGRQLVLVPLSGPPAL